MIFQQRPLLERSLRLYVPPHVDELADSEIRVNVQSGDRAFTDLVIDDCRLDELTSDVRQNLQCRSDCARSVLVTDHPVRHAARLCAGETQAILAANQ